MFFPTTRVISLLYVMPDGSSVKIAVVGWERVARQAAKNHIDALAVESGVEKLRELGLEWFPFQFRDLRPKAATDKERSAGMAETRRFLGHTTERQTADYVRDKIGELTDPVSASPPEWMAKVLSPKTHSSA